MESLLEKANRVSAQWHKEANNTYGGQPYTVHLDMVDGFAVFYEYLIPLLDRDLVRAGCRFHDTIEDNPKTYNDVKAEMGVIIAEFSYALANEKGRTRKERANAKYYKGIRKVHYAAFIKLCDRLANVNYSKNMRSSMFYKYKQENDNFCKSLYGPWWIRFLQFFGLFKNIENIKSKYHDMFEHLDVILE